MTETNIDHKTYSSDFKNYYNKVKFADFDEQKALIVDFFKYLLLGYEKGFNTIKDVGAWCTSTALVAEVGSSKEGTFYGDLIKLGYEYGDSFDIGEREVKEVWGITWEEAEKVYIKRLKDFISNYSS